MLKTILHYYAALFPAYFVNCMQKLQMNIAAPNVESEERLLQMISLAVLCGQQFLRCSLTVIN